MHPRIKTLLRKAAARSRVARWVAAGVITQRLRSALEQHGYVRSQLQGESVDQDGNPVPWLPFPVTTFLDGRVRGEFTVFEFGSGNSTLWWATRVARVIACEHDSSFFGLLEPQLPENVTYLYRELGDNSAYEDTILDFGGQIDIVVVDGRHRPECLRTSAQALTPGGVIILDNSDSETLHDAIVELENSGFKRLAIEGLTSLQTWVNETSIFYRENNLLGI